MENVKFRHEPVLLEECIEGLNIKPDGVYLDGTAGGAGHSAAIAERLQSGRLIALDKDPAAVRAAGERLGQFPGAEVVQSDFRDADRVLDRLGIPAVDGILLDLGVSSHQIDTAERGFSYMHDGALDMRMGDSGPSARDLLAEAPREELIRILREYGEERFAPRIADGIVRARETGEIATTGQLNEIIERAIPAAARREGGHPSKRTFQALRIAVNRELDSLSEGLERMIGKLASGGRICILTFHSLEDRIVKQQFADWARGCVCPPDFPVCVCGREPIGKLVMRKPVTAGPEELGNNPRSKSAKLRVFEKR